VPEQPPADQAPQGQDQGGAAPGAQ
jgi:hypothetical protein